jgi:hypothetical protein
MLVSIAPMSPTLFDFSFILNANIEGGTEDNADGYDNGPRFEMTT